MCRSRIVEVLFFIQLVADGVILTVCVSSSNRLSPDRGGFSSFGKEAVKSPLRAGAPHFDVEAVLLLAVIMHEMMDSVDSPDESHSSFLHSAFI